MKKYIQQKLIPKTLGSYLGLLAYIAPKKSGNKALEIFSTPRRGKVRPKEEPFLAGFQKEILWYNDIKIQCYKKGNGLLKIMFLHGWESNTARWKPLMDYIESRMDVTFIAIDAPAHGNTSGLLFDSIIYANCIHKAYQHFIPNVLIGHSIGAGSIAYCISEIEPLDVNKVILMGSPNGFDEIIKSYIDIIQLNKKGQKALNRSIFNKYAMQPDDYNVSKYAKKINAKTLVIHDTKDDISNIENARLITANLKQGELFITNTYGHSLQHENIFQKIVSFLQ